VEWVYLSQRDLDGCEGDVGSDRSCCPPSWNSASGTRSKEGALDSTGVDGDNTGVAGTEGAGVTGNFSRVGSISVKYIPIPLARPVMRRARF
jgi:hypothetical protein